MNRLNLVHTGARTELPEFFGTHLPIDRPTRAGRVAPLAVFYLAIAAFMSCGAAVVATASFIALHIQ